MTSVALSSPEAQLRPAAARDTAIDFTKGILVLFMVLYHWLNYFIASSGHFFNYLRFLTPSFIFITGFMISQIHIQKYGTYGLRLPRRLLNRGLKLLAIYIGLNSLILFIPGGFLARHAYASSSLPATLFSVFVTGNTTVYGGQKTSSFGILLVIAYLLVLSAALTLLSRRVKYAFHFLLLFVILSILFLGLEGTESANLDLLMSGILGVVFGYAKKAQVVAVTKHTYSLCGIYLIYLITITFWNVTLPIQIIGVVFTTALIYKAGQSTKGSDTFRERAILLGKYSLFGYIAQIAILQALRKWLWFPEYGVMGLTISFVLGFALTFYVVDILDWARLKSAKVNHLYAIVFG